MKNSSIFRTLILLNFLLKGRYSKKELIEEYDKLSIEVKESSVTNYIKKLQQNNIDIKQEKNGKIIKYYVENIKPSLEITSQNLKILFDIKQLIFSQANYQLIKYIVELFYKISPFIKDKNLKEEFLDFGYFSNVNWGLINILEYHCRTKDILVLDYLLPKGGNKFITYHVDKIILNTMSKRLYLYGLLENGYSFFEFPIERIFAVKKVIRKNVPFNFKIEVIKYTISKRAFQQAILEENEIVIEQNDKTVTIQAPVVNEFNLVQKLLNFCPDLYYISEGKIRNLVKEKLELIYAQYVK